MKKTYHEFLGHVYDDPVVELYAIKPYSGNPFYFNGFSSTRTPQVSLKKVKGHSIEKSISYG